MNAEADLHEAGLALLQPGAPALARFPALELDGQPARVFIAARHAVVTEILCDEPRFSLRHYDDLLGQVAGQTRYLVGENDTARQLRVRILRAAQARVDTMRGAPPPAGPPQLDRGFRDFIAAMAREEAARILDVFAPRLRTAETIDFVREYAFLLAYRMARRIVGAPGPDRAPGLVRLLVAVRNLVRGGRWLRLQGELGVANTMLELQRPLFGHVFGTVVSSPGWLQGIARATARDGLAAIDRAWALDGLAPKDSLLAAMKAVRGEFLEVADADYAVQARSVLFELTGALSLIVGKSLAEIAGLAVSPAGHAAGIGWNELGALLAGDDPSRRSHDAAINEMLRLAGGSRLVRTVRSAGAWQGVDLVAGDRLVLLIDRASRDPAAFAEPGRFMPDPDRPYLTSGPFEGPHVCYGRAIAWTILREAIVAARGRIAPQAGAKLAVFAGLPDALAFEQLGVAPTSCPRPRPIGRNRHQLNAPLAAGQVRLRDQKVYSL